VLRDCIQNQILLGAKIKENKLVGACSTHIGHKKLEKDVNLNVQVKKKKRRRAGVDSKIKLKWFVKKSDLKLWTGFIWLRTGPITRLL